MIQNCLTSVLFWIRCEAFFYKNKLFHVKFFNKYILYMGILVNFLPIGRFSLDKKIPRAIVSEPIEVFRLTISENPGTYEKNAYRGLRCT